jgi:hypothetical protein
MESIKTKIKELTPDLYMKSDIDFNFIDKITAREEEREAFKHHLPTLSGDQKVAQESEDEDPIQFRKVLPRETFDPTPTPDDREVLQDFVRLRDKLRTAIRSSELNIEALEVICEESETKFPMDLENLIAQGRFLIKRYNQALEEERDR